MYKESILNQLMTVAWSIINIVPTSSATPDFEYCEEKDPWYILHHAITNIKKYG